ncbi:MAG: amidohydrolase [Planctomycetes bacterium]|nr:amidohydrolase [Planctomycetota bacterium]
MSAPLGATERAALVATRRDLHAHPELAFEERRTAALVADRLEAAGYRPRRGVGGTGVLADLDGAAPGPTILLRADMDALPLVEEGDVPYASTAPGRMHACGHDGHTAALLACAERLAARRGALRGRVRLCFQPAEEGRGGAERVIAEGALDGVDACFGVHLWTELDVGLIGLAVGPVMAAVDRFEAVIEGQGGHGAIPHQTRDPIVAAAHVVTALQSIVARTVSPLDTAVVTVARLAAGEEGSWNIIPRVARLSGTARAYAEDTWAALPGRIEQVVRGVAEALGCRATLEYERICAATVNEPAMTDLARAVARDLLGPEAVRTDGDGVRTLAGEDFSAFLRRVPGCFAFVGGRNAARGLVHPHHSPRFDFDEDALEHAARLLEGVALRYLGAW